MADRWCVTCKWCFIPAVGVNNQECRHPDNVQTDPVTGRSKPIYQWCENMRRLASPCGPTGEWYEARQEPA